MAPSKPRTMVNQDVKPIMWESLHACCARNMHCNMEKPPGTLTCGLTTGVSLVSGERGWRGTVSHLLTTHFKRCTQRYLEVFPLYICVGITPDKSLSHNTSRICFQPRERFKKQQYFSTSPYSDVHTPTFKGPSVYKRGTLRHLGTRGIGGTEFC